MLSILTTTPLRFGWGDAIGISGVATDPCERSRGLGKALIERVLAAAEEAREAPAALFARDPRLYERCGFETADLVVQGPLVCSPDEPLERLSDDEVHAIYARWAAIAPDRLVRDPQRWRYWQWRLRHCEPHGEGYICLESGLTREAIVEPGLPAWPVPPQTEWIGLRMLTDALQVPLATRTEGMALMTYRFPSPPVMFMTDQF
jgi:hypothetical protein